MGVAGCGKSTLGALLAGSIGAPFLDGDSLHPQRNIDKMAAGVPLSDEDRRPWLEEIGRLFAAAGPSSLVIACSALKEHYRRIIRGSSPDVLFVHLHGTEKLLASRMAVRPGHFMPVSLLRSQLQTLEPLTSDEIGVVLDVRNAPEELAQQTLTWLQEHYGTLRGQEMNTVPSSGKGEASNEPNHKVNAETLSAIPGPGKPTPHAGEEQPLACLTRSLVDNPPATK